MGVSSDISDVKELKGRKIGISGIGERSDLLTRVILRRAGLDPLKDVEMVPVGLSPNRVAALSKNIIQGAPLTPEIADRAKQLGFIKPIAGEGYYRVYDVSGQTARSIARQVAERTKSLGQDAVQLVGPADAPVSRVAIGTGAITPFMHFLDAYRVDLAICTDDGFTYWRDGALAIDMGIPVIVVNHPVAEVYGMKLLADHLSNRFPDVPVHFIPQSCMFQLIRG